MRGIITFEYKFVKLKSQEFQMNTRSSVFTDTQKLNLGDYRVQYKANKPQAATDFLCGLRAAEMLRNITDLIAQVLTTVQNDKELSSVIRKYSESTGNQVVLSTQSFEDRVIEFNKHLSKVRNKARSEVRRLRKI